MAKTDFKSADEYIATFPPEIQEILQTVRKAIRDAVPEAEEVISYQIPAFKYHGWVMYYSAYAKHFSLSMPPPFTAFVVFKEQLKQYKQSKSAVQFPYDQPVPVKLIGDMAAVNAKANIENEAAKKKK